MTDKPNSAQVLCDLALNNPTTDEMVAQLIPIVMELDARVAVLEAQRQEVLKRVK